MNRFSKLVAVLAALPIFAFASTAIASSPGQLGGGPNVYMVKNVTNGGSYANTISASACGTVQYRTVLNNGGYGGLTNIEVKVSLPSSKSNSFVSNMTATPDQGTQFGTSGTATVNASSDQTLSYVSGSTRLTDIHGNLIKTLSDGITASGINAGNLAGSTTELVTFQAKLSCPVPPKVELACTALDVNKIDRTHYDFTAHGSVQNATIQSYGFTAKNSDGSTVDTNTVNTDALSAVYHFNQSTPGTYTVSAVVNTDHGSAGGDQCVKQITVASVPPTTPPKVKGATTLPNTGAGDVLGIFTGASAFGGVGHFLVSRRKRGL